MEGILFLSVTHKDIFPNPIPSLQLLLHHNTIYTLQLCSNMSPSQNKENFVKIHQIQERMINLEDEYITTPCYFKIVSDKNFREGHTLLVADGHDKAKDYLHLEFKPSVKAVSNARGKIYWPGSIVKGQMLKIHNNKILIVENTYLQILSSTKQLPPSLSAENFDSIPVEKRNIKLRDLTVLKETTPISESLSLKITGKTVGVGNGGQECLNLKICDETERMVLKVWNPSHLNPLISQVQVGDFCRFKNLILKFQENKKGDGEGGNELFLQNVGKYTMMEKLGSKEIASFPKIPANLALGDADFHGKIIGMENFEWTSLCHACPNLIKTSKCKAHQHGAEFDIRSYSFRLIGYDGSGEKKEFFVRKEQVETFRNKSISLGGEFNEDADERLSQAFESLLEQPVNIIYNISMKSPHVLFATQVTLIGTIDNPNQQEVVRESAKKKKKRPALTSSNMDEEGNEKKKKKKKKKVKTVVVVDNDDDDDVEEEEDDEA